MTYTPASPKKRAYTGLNSEVMMFFWWFVNSELRGYVTGQVVVDS